MVMTEIASEDSLRLNVLLANKPLAIRIDESRMIVYGLSDMGEAKVPLNPSGRPETYVRAVKELLSGHILGSPGGYPVYIQRWARMGQMRDESLEQLLMLGEPEAVVAAVCSPGLTDELARRAWWAMEDAENARYMLRNPAIARGGMGKVLAAYLVEYLPFETDSDKMMESLRLVLQPGLITAPERQDLWKRSERKQSYLVGFLQALPDDLPDPVPPRVDAQARKQVLAPLAERGNPCAAQIGRVLSSQGQTYIRALSKALAKPPNQDVVQSTFETTRDYFSPLRPEGGPDQPLEVLMTEAQAFSDPARAPEPALACLEVAPDLAGEIAAMRMLSGLGYGVIRPVLRGSTAIGSLMRRKLKPLLDSIEGQIALLRGGGS